MNVDSNSCFGDHWETGIEVHHRVNSYKYWKRKIQREIHRSVSLRDRKSLSDLVKYSVLLRDAHRETFISSSSVTSLFSGVAYLTPKETPFIEIFTEYLSRLPKLAKTLSCRLVLNTVCMKFNYEKILQEKLGELTTRSSSPFFDVEDVSELRISLSLLHDIDQHYLQKLTLFRKDPTIDLPLQDLMPHFDESDWIYLVNRIDKMPNDLDSWQCFCELLNRCSDASIAAIKEYVGSYWTSYHNSIQVPEDVELARTDAFLLLSL